MLSRFIARMRKFWPPKEEALDWAQTYLKQAGAEKARGEYDQALHSLIQAKAALKTQLKGGDHLVETKRLLAELHQIRAQILPLTKDFTIEQVRQSYLKALTYSPDAAQQEEIQVCLDALARSPNSAIIQRKPTLLPSAVPSAPVLPPRLPAPFFTRRASPTLLAQPYRLVGPDEIENTRHLAWCLQQTSRGTAEHKPLYTLAREVAECFGERTGKDIACMHEAAELATIPYPALYNQLISHAVAALNPVLHAPLNSAVVQGLAVIVRNCPASLLKKAGGVRADTWTSILSVLLTRLEKVHKTDTESVKELIEAMSQLLDAMVQAGVAGISREQLQAPLYAVLRNLNPHQDVDLAWHIRYMREALAYVPNDESTGEAVLRCLFSAGKGVLSLASAIKNCDIDKLLANFENFEATFNGVREFANTIGAAGGLKAAIQDAQEMVTFFGELSTSYTDRSRQRGWYTALQCLDMLIETKEWAKFEHFVRQSAYRQHPDFLQGVCQRLKRIVCVEDDAAIQRQANLFLKSLKQDSAQWLSKSAGGQSVLKADQEPLEQKVTASLARLEKRNNTVPGLHEIDSDQDWYALSKADLSTQLLQAARHKLDKSLVKKLLNVLQDHIKRLRTDYLKGLAQDKEIKNALANYVAPEGMGLRDDTRFDLAEKIQTFLASDKKSLLLLGEAGAGKSTLNRHVVRELWQAYTQANRPKEQAIPVFIALSSLPNTSTNLVHTFFAQQGFSDAQIHTLQTQYHFVLILDGFDEIEHRQRAFYTDNQLDAWKHAKIIISSRPEYLGSGYRYKFHPSGDPTALQEYRIAPFSANTIARYVEQYSRNHPHAVWSAKEYQQAFNEPKLQALVSNPFLLKMAVSVLPALSAAGIQGTRFTRLSLYAQFVKSWFARSQQRLASIQLDIDEAKEFKQLEEHGFDAHQMDFSQELALQMYQAGEVISSYNEPTSSLKSRGKVSSEPDWRTHLLGNGDIRTRLKRFNAPLIVQDKANGLGKTYRFIHKSLRDYLVAWALWEEFTAEDELDSAAWLNTLDIANDPAILDFLSERVKQEATFKGQLLAVIERTKTDAALARGAANAITVLARAGIQFIGADLKGIRIPGANLSHGVFEGAQLQGADLRKVTLRASWLREASLSNAQMAGVKFGEWPTLQEESEIFSCAYSPDGKTCAMGLRNGNISVYDTSSWTKIHTLTGHTASVNSVVYSPSGAQIASGSEDETVRLWDAQTGEPGPTLTGHTDGVRSVVYSPSGAQIASGSSDQTVRLWDAQTGAPGLTLTGHTDLVSSVVYSPSGAQIASGSSDQTVRLWDAQTGEPGPTLTGHTDGVRGVVYSPSGAQIASGSFDKTVRLWDAQTGKPGPTLTGHSYFVLSVVYSPSGAQIASSSADQTVRLWDAQTGEPGPTLTGHTDWVYSVVYSPSGAQIASGSSDQTVRLWDAQTGEPGPTLTGHTNGVYSVVYSPSGAQIASGSSDQTVRLWDAQTGEPGPTLTGHTDGVNSVVYSPSGAQIASGSDDRTVRLWDAQTGAPGLTLTGHTDLVSSVVYSPSGAQIVSGSWDETVRLWDAQTGAPGLTLIGHTASVNSVVYSPSGAQIASSSEDKTVRLWDAQTGEPGPTLTGHTEGVYSVAYSPSSLQIASGSRDKTVRLWDVQTGEPGPTLIGHTDGVYSVAYLPSGAQIASGSGDQTVRLWDIASGKCLKVIQGFSRWIESVAWKVTPEGDYLLTGSGDSVVRQWQLITEEAGYQAHLRWMSPPAALSVTDSMIDGVTGLSGRNKALLQQRGAVGEPALPVGDEEEIALPD